MAAITTAPVKRSWAQIVEGNSNSDKDSQKSKKPAARGSLMCSCRGEVLTMLSHFGWLMLYGDVDHVSAEQHEGDVYIHKDDVVDGETLRPGDIVHFYLYVDEKGIGAEECRLEQRSTSQFNSNAAPFVPMAETPNPESKGFTLSSSAEEYTPGELVQATAEPEIDILGWSNAFSRLAHIFALHEEDSDEEEYPNAMAVSDDEYASSEAPVSEDDQYVIHKSWTAKHAPPSDGSTSAGETSDSEDECSFEMLAVLRKAMPPGMELPPNFRPPPGLSLPSHHEEALVF